MYNGGSEVRHIHCNLPSLMTSSSVDELVFRVRTAEIGGGDRILKDVDFFARFLAGKFKFVAGSDCLLAISLAICRRRSSSSSSLPVSSEKSAIAGPESVNVLTFYARKLRL